MEFSQEALLTISWLSDAVFQELEAKTRQRCYFETSIRNNLMEYITLRLDSTNEAEQWYVRHNKIVMPDLPLFYFIH